MNERHTVVGARSLARFRLAPKSIAYLAAPPLSQKARFAGAFRERCCSLADAALPFPLMKESPKKGLDNLRLLW